jgi:signal transduction histidine kinase
METAVKTDKPPARSLPEAIARSLRHEVGDLLQSVYSSVAILQNRLPADWSLERRILSDTRKRAETCKRFLDSVHDYVCPMTLSYEPVDLLDLWAGLVREAEARHPQLHIELQPATVPAIHADSRRLTQLGEALLANACEAAAHQVRLQSPGAFADSEIQWIISDDGPGVAAEHLDRLFTPFFSTRHGHPGLGLALAQKIANLHGGRISAENAPGGGFCVRVVLPVGPPAATPAGQPEGPTRTRGQGS